MKKELKEAKRNLKITWSFLKQRKKKLIVSTILAILTSIISIIVPVLSARLLLNLTSELYLELIYVAIFIFIVESTRNVVSYFLNKISDSYTIDTITDIQIEMAKETLKIKTSEIDKNTSGTFIDRINNDTNDIINIIGSLTRSIINFLTNIGVLIATLMISPHMFLYFVASSLIISHVEKRRRDEMYKRHKHMLTIREKRTGLISELIRGLKDVRLLSAEEGMLKKTKQRLLSVNKERKDMLNVGTKYRLLSGNIRDLSDVLFLILGTLLVSFQKLTGPNFVVLYMYRGRVESLLEFYNDLAELLKNYNLSATRVFEVLTDAYEKEVSGKEILKEIKGHIKLENVSFAYNKEEVLKNVSFEIKPGERVGFVGESGSGKSTIFSLLTKLYIAEEGKILIDGIDIKDIENHSLRKNVSLIPQSPYIFNFSIKDNLLLADNKATHEQLIEATKKAELYDRILEFEDGFETEVGEGGVTLSGGERQRLAIARSLLKRANIILFDEATSALDNITQDKVQKAIYGLDKDKTILIIAHRLSTVINCDKIIVLDDGQVLDIGPHEELLKRCSKYQELYQFEENNR